MMCIQAELEIWLVLNPPIMDCSACQEKKTVEVQGKELFN